MLCSAVRLHEGKKPEVLTRSRCEKVIACAKMKSIPSLLKEPGKNNEVSIFLCGVMQKNNTSKALHILVSLKLEFDN